VSSGTYVVSGEVDGRRARVFSRNPLVPTQSWEELARADTDDDDLARLARIEPLLRTGRVSGMAHPGVDPPDVVHVFLGTAPSDRTFACVIVSEPRLQQMLQESAVVVEGVSLEVAHARFLRPRALRAALEAWVERNFPGVPVPMLDVSPWMDPDATPVFPPAGLRSLAGAPASWSPADVAVQPAFERAA
jgi:hypothetical protein